MQNYQAGCFETSLQCRSVRYNIDPSLLVTLTMNHDPQKALEAVAHPSSTDQIYKSNDDDDDNDDDIIHWHMHTIIHTYIYNIYVRYIRMYQDVLCHNVSDVSCGRLFPVQTPKKNKSIKV